MRNIGTEKLGKLKLGLTIAHEESPYAGIVRPFINWAKGFKNLGIDADLILYRTSNRIATHVEKLKLKHHLIGSEKELKKVLKNEGYNYIVIDDHIKFRRVNLASIITKFTKLIIYAQILFGVHAIFPLFKLSALPVTQRILYKTVSIMPFSLLRPIYINYMSKADMVIANSKVTETLLYLLYGIRTHGVVYPPVDTEIFKPMNVSLQRRVLLYLGSHAGDTDPHLIVKICTILEKKGLDIVTFGNSRLAKYVKQKCEIEHIHDVSDEELAKLYSSSIATIAPQQWEQFGYVVAEAVACGRPVVAFNAMGPSEIAQFTDLVVLANSEKDLLRIVRRIDSFESKKTIVQVLPFSLNNSVAEFVKIILSQ